MGNFLLNEILHNSEELKIFIMDILNKFLLALPSNASTDTDKKLKLYAIELFCAADNQTLVSTLYNAVMLENDELKKKMQN